MSYINNNHIECYTQYYLKLHTTNLKSKMSVNPNNPNNSDETVFIPCEICEEPVAIENYTEHTNACNSARFVEFHGVSLADLLNPPQIVRHVPLVPHEIDFADNLASDYEREPDEGNHELGEEPDEDEIGSEDEGPIAGEPQPNVRIVPMSALFRALMIGDINQDEIIGQQAQEPQPEPILIDNLMNRLQHIINNTILGQQQAGGLGGLDDVGLNALEDVAVGLTPEQHKYCLTAKTTIEPQTCNICCEDNITEITTLICGHEFCSPCATRHFTANVKCPFCNQDLRDIINGNT
jgi:hypothetical protein